MWTAQSVHISGATGVSAHTINAEFTATQEKTNGAPVFVCKHDRSSGLWVGRDGNWWLGRMKEKGQNRGNAYLGDKVNPLAQSAIWKVWVGSKFEDQSFLRIQAPS